MPWKPFLLLKTSEGQDFKQKRQLLVNVNEAYEVFKREEPGLKIGRSKFASLLLRQVIPMTLLDQEMCMCKYRENINDTGWCKDHSPKSTPRTKDLLIQSL